MRRYIYVHFSAIQAQFEAKGRQNALKRSNYIKTANWSEIPSKSVKNATVIWDTLVTHG